MAKNIGILIDPETGDLQIDPRRNDQNVYVQGLQVGEVTIQNQAAILQAMKGELKEYPTQIGRASCRERVYRLV